MTASQTPGDKAAVVMVALRERMRRVGFVGERTLIEALEALHSHAVELDVRLAMLEEKTPLDHDD
jgi:hypothetical protein